MDDTPPKFAVNVRDPWAQAIVHGPKRIENRDQRPPEKIEGERVAVYCSMAVDEKAGNDLRVDPLPPPWSEWPEIADACQQSRIARIAYRHHPGHIIGTVRVVGWARPDTENFPPEGDWHFLLDYRGAGGWDWLQYVNYDPPGAVADDPWWLDTTSHAWLLAAPQPLAEPAPVDGGDVLPGVWTLPDDLREQVGGYNANS